MGTYKIFLKNIGILRKFFKKNFLIFFKYWGLIKILFLNREQNMSNSIKDKLIMLAKSNNFCSLKDTSKRMKRPKCKKISVMYLREK